MNKKGISLIVLVITIIVMIIIAGAIILSLNSSNIVEKAKIANLLTKVEAYNQEMQMSFSNLLLDDLGFNSSVISRDGEYMKTYIPSMKNEDINKFRIIEGKLTYVNIDDVFAEAEKTAMKKMGIYPSTMEYEENIGVFDSTTDYTGVPIYINPAPTKKPTEDDIAFSLNFNDEYYVGPTKEDGLPDRVDYMYSTDNFHSTYLYKNIYELPEGVKITFNGIEYNGGDLVNVNAGWYKIKQISEIEYIANAMLPDSLPIITNAETIDFNNEQEATNFGYFASTNPYIAK